MIIAALVAGTRLCAREEGDKFGGGPNTDRVDAVLKREATIEAAMKYNRDLDVARRGCTIGSIEDNFKRDGYNEGIKTKASSLFSKPVYSIWNFYRIPKEVSWLRLLNHDRKMEKKGQCFDHGASFQP